MASRNPRIQIPGAVPHLGSRVNISWPYVVALSAGIAGVHFVFSALAIWAARVVIIKDDSNLSTARLLRPVVNDLRTSGTMLTGKELSQVIDNEKDFGEGIVYGPREVDGCNVYYLDIGHDVRLRKAWKDKRHPDGTYQ